RFELSNNGSAPLTCPDSWFLKFEDGRLEPLSLTNITVQPGEKAIVAVTNPVTSGAWRLVADYYFEDFLFEVKVKIDRSALRNVLPQSASSVRGQLVMSDWIK